MPRISPFSINQQVGAISGKLQECILGRLPEFRKHQIKRTIIQTISAANSMHSINELMVDSLHRAPYGDAELIVGSVRSITRDASPAPGPRAGHRSTMSVMSSSLR